MQFRLKRGAIFAGKQMLAPVFLQIWLPMKPHTRTAQTYLQTEPSVDPSSLTRWRQRIGEEGVELLLATTIEAARAAGLIKRASLDKVIVDTTVMPKAIAHPTDSRCWSAVASTWSSSRRTKA